MHGTGNLKPMLCDTLEADGGGGREVGEGFEREGTHVYLMFTLMYGRNQHIIVMCCNSN